MKSRLLKMNLHKVAALFATLLTVFLLDVSAGFAESQSRASGPVINLPTEAKKCIRPTEFMRKNHMKLLLHKRDQTMHKGIRTQDASIKTCINCHSKKDTNGVPIPVNAPGQFCSTCHEYAAVKLDCFECHRTTPDPLDKTAAIPNTPEHAQLLANNMSAIRVQDVENLRSYLEEAK